MIDDQTIAHRDDRSRISTTGMPKIRKPAIVTWLVATSNPSAAPPGGSGRPFQ